MIALGSLCCLLITSQAYAGHADLFKYDSKAIDKEMGQLIRLEDYVNGHPGTTLTNLLYENNILVADIGKAEGMPGLNLINEKLLGIPGFMWGCCLGFTGVLIVALVAEDKHETKQSIKGALITVGVLAVGGTVAYLLFYFYLLDYM